MVADVIAKKGFILWQRNITKIEICPRENVKLTLFRMAFVIRVFFLLHLLSSSAKRTTLVVLII